MKAQHVLEIQASLMSEAELQAKVVALAKTLGYLCYHTHFSRRSEPGFPDLVLVRERVVFAELKSQRGQLSADQRKWRDELRRTGANAHVWRPADLLAGTIVAELTKRR